MVDGQRRHRPDLCHRGRRNRHRPQAGNVVFAGTLTLTGGTVVIDHGCGVKSYLYGLETVGVERGQSVSAGDPLGTAGTDPQPDL